MNRPFHSIKAALPLARPRSSHLLVALLLVAAHLVLSVIYGMATPVFESSDEPFHYAYVKHLADGNGLPSPNAPNGSPWRQEGTQPPLYYALASLVARSLDSGTPEINLELNPHVQFGLVDVPGNKNLFIHSPDENFPYKGEFLPFQAVRFLSSIIGAVTVLLVFYVALQVVPSLPFAVGATVFAAFNPMFISVSASVNNDILVAALSTLVLLLNIRIIKNGVNFRLLLFLGLFLGLATLSKLSALGLIPLTILSLAVVAYRHRSLTLFAKSAVIVLGITTIVSGWWFIRNQMLYEDWLALKPHLDIIGTRDPTTSPLELLPELEQLFLSYWGVFGWSNVLTSRYFYDAMKLLSVLAMGGVALFAFRRRHANQGIESRLLFLLAVWFMIVLASWAQWNQLIWASYGRLLFPAIAAISIFLFLGLSSLLPSRFTGILAGSLALFGFSFALACPFLFILPSYPGHVSYASGELEAVENRIYVDYDGKIALLGFELSSEDVSQGDRLTVTLFWRSMANMENNYSVFIHLITADGVPLAQVDSYPNGGSYPTSRWQVGDQVEDTYVLTIDNSVPAASLVWVDAGFYQLQTMENLPAFDSAGRSFNPRIARIRVSPKVPPTYSIPSRVMLTLGNKIELLGYKIHTPEIKLGQEAEVSLYWRALQKLDNDYSVFIHLVDEAGYPLVQSDSQPRNDTYPTSLWQAGETVEDQHTIVLPDDLTPGQYRLVAGIYLLQSGERLRLADGKSDTVDLGRITIVKK